MKKLHRNLKCDRCWHSYTPVRTIIEAQVTNHTASPQDLPGAAGPSFSWSSSNPLWVAADSPEFPRVLCKQHHTVWDP